MNRERSLGSARDDMKHMKPSTQTKKKTDIFTVTIILFVFVVTFFVLFLQTPEQVSGMSSDRTVRVEGASHDPSSIQILKLSDSEKSIAGMIAPVYEVDVLGGKTVDRAIVSYMIPPSLLTENVNQLTLIIFDPLLLSWQPVQTSVDRVKKSLSTTVSVRGTLMIGLGKK